MITIDKFNYKDTVSIIQEKFGKIPKNGNLKKHFGKLKRSFDGLAYQKAMREG